MAAYCSSQLPVAVPITSSRCDEMEAFYRVRTHVLQSRARPHSVLFQSTYDSAYATDLGADRLNQIALNNAVPTVESRLSFAPGSGPSHIVLHPSGRLLFVVNRLRPGITVVAIDAASGALQSASATYPVDAECAGPIALSATGDRIYIASVQRTGETILSAFAFAQNIGKPRLIQRTSVPRITAPEQLMRHDNQLLLVGAGGVVSVPIERRSGLLGVPIVAVLEPDAVSLALRTIM
jgi:6-phosphogluconolactonase (cycloisomerase 2 family)